MSSSKSLSERPVVIVGSSNTDMVIRMDRIPGIGETVIGGTLHTAGGGKGANQAVAASRAGAKVCFIGKIGKDDFGKATMSNLKRDKIDLRHLSVDRKAASGVAFIFVGANGDNSIAVASGANMKLTARDVARANDAFKPGGVLLVQLEAPLSTVEAAISKGAKRRMLVILNPAPARELSESLLKHVDILTPNEHEAQTLTGIKVTDRASAAAAAAVLRKQGVKTVIITLGSQGAYVADGIQEHEVPAFKVKAVDTTGAGDVFSGALAASLAGGNALLEAVRFAQAAAALSVTRFGAQPSAPKRPEILRLLGGGTK